MKRQEKTLMFMRHAVCLALLSCLVSASAGAQTIEVVTEDGSYSYMREGKVTGVASTIVEATLREAGLTDYELSIYPWARAYDRALVSPDVLIYPIVRTAEREPLFKWVGQIARIDPQFYKLRERTDIVVKGVEDARSYSVGVVRDDMRQQALQGMGFTRMVVSATNAENFRKLLNRQVQLVPMPERDARLQAQAAHVAFSDLEAVYSLDDQGYSLYLAFSNTTSDELVKRMVAAFERLKANGTVQRLLDEDR
jgi:polar amino acid transport system substrate-binding protein